MERKIPGGMGEEIAKVYSAAEKATRELLERYPNFITPNVVVEIAKMEGERAGQVYLKNQNENPPNDVESENPGLTAYLTREGYDEVVDVFEKAGCPIQFDVDNANVEGLGRINHDLYVMRLPQGCFVVGPRAVNFFRETEKTTIGGYDQASKKGLFMLTKDVVIRITGDSGKLWQNPLYKWSSAVEAINEYDDEFWPGDR